PGERAGQVVHRVERADGHAQVVYAASAVELLLDDLAAASGLCEQRAGVDALDVLGGRAKPRRPARIGAADQQRGPETPPNERNPLEAVGERALVQEQLGPAAEGAVAAERTQRYVEQFGRHGALVR